MCCIEKYTLEIVLFSGEAPTSPLQKISGFLTRRYAPLHKTLIFVTDYE